jgi:hypothetical protein
MKMNLGEGGIKGFFVRNCEKMVFGLAVLLVIWVALPSREHTPVPEELTPKHLNELVRAANERLDSNQWSVIKNQRFSAPDDYLAKIPQNAVSASGYLADLPLNKPLFPSAEKRRDPELFPVEKLEIAVAYGPVVEIFKPEDGEDAPEEEAAEEETRPLPASVERRYRNVSNVATGGGDTKTVGRYIVSIRGLVPYKAQKEEYKARFADSTSYVPERDTPKYGAGAEQPGYRRFYYMVERAEVAPDGVPGKWVPIGTSKIAYNVQKQWPPSSVDAELADPLAVDARFAMPAPPLLLRDLKPLSLHSQVRSAAEAKAAQRSAEDPKPAEETDDPDAFDPLAGPAADPADPAPVGNRPAPPAHGEREGGGPIASGAYQSAEDAEYKLFRYFDMTAEPGKSYVYRVKLFLEDPNDPEVVGKATENAGAVSRKPPTASLDKSVIERLARKPKADVWWRETPYSEVSPVARIPATKQVLAGAVDPGKLVRKQGEQFEIRQSEEMVKLMGLVWDENKAMDVPGVQDVSRGSVINFRAETEAVDPGRRLLVKLPDYSFDTDTLVLDLRGGEEFGRNSLTAPGEVLMMDGDGKMIVRHELEDWSTFQDHNFPPETKATTTGDLPMPEDDDERPRRGGERTPPRPTRTRPGSDDGNILN